MRLIDADSLKKSIEANRFSSETDYLECLYQIDQQPTAQQWILCSERLPNTSGTYIVTRWFCKGESDERLLPDACYFDGTDTFYDDTRINHSRPYVTDSIVAWMPLPNPYEDKHIIGKEQE